MWVTTSGILKSGHHTDGSVGKGSCTLLECNVGSAIKAIEKAASNRWTG